MNDPVLFSIVVPTYNRAHLISSTIESILAQTYKNYEIIIVDDGSTDNTEEVIQKYLSDQVYYYKKENAERAAARNFGTSKAKGTYINWFDSDDIMLPDHLQEAANVISKYNKPEIFAMGFLYRTISGKIIQVFTHPENINAHLYKGNFIANSPVMVRKDISLVYQFNEDRDLSGSEDYELWLRIASRYTIYSSSKITVALIEHDERSTISMNNTDQLVTRFRKFLYYTTSNKEIVTLLNDHYGSFLMKTYLLLAVALSINGQTKTSCYYISQAFKNSPKIMLERGFYAFIKYTVKNTFSF